MLSELQLLKHPVRSIIKNDPFIRLADENKFRIGLMGRIDTY
jgi:hypothetical protein